MDSLDYPAQQYDLTYGRLRGSADRVGILANPTPGTANATRFWEETVEAADLGTVEFSVQAGFYSDTVTLELTCGDPDAAIVYTTDGSLPTTSSELYTGPITIASREGDANRYVSLAASYQGEWVSAYAYDYAPDPVDKATTITARVYKKRRAGAGRYRPHLLGGGWNRTRCRWSASPPRSTICSVRRVSICPGPPTIPCASTAAWTSPAISFQTRRSTPASRSWTPAAACCWTPTLPCGSPAAGAASPPR